MKALLDENLNVYSNLSGVELIELLSSLYNQGGYASIIDLSEKYRICESEKRIYFNIYDLYIVLNKLKDKIKDKTFILEKNNTSGNFTIDTILLKLKKSKVILFEDILEMIDYKLKKNKDFIMCDILKYIEFIDEDGNIIRAIDLINRKNYRNIQNKEYKILNCDIKTLEDIFLCDGIYIEKED